MAFLLLHPHPANRLNMLNILPLDGIPPYRGTKSLMPQRFPPKSGLFFMR